MPLSMDILLSNPSKEQDDTDWLQNAIEIVIMGHNNGRAQAGVSIATPVVLLLRHEKINFIWFSQPINTSAILINYHWVWPFFGFGVEKIV